MIFHEVVSTTVHVDIHHVPPSPGGCPYHILVTSGMSERAMKTPPGEEEFAHAELFVALPAWWTVTMEAFKDERNYWPIRMLKVLARLPHEYDSWLSAGHSAGNGDPPAPYAPGTKLCGAVLAPPISAPSDFSRVVRPDGCAIHFWQVIPLYQEEMDLKIQQGANALFERFNRYRVSAVIDPVRRNVARPRFRLW